MVAEVTKTFTMRMPLTLHRELQRRARAEGVTMTEIVRRRLLAECGGERGDVKRGGA